MPKCKFHTYFLHLFICVLLPLSTVFPGLAQATSTAINLTSEERAWLEAHPVVRVHNESDWAPFNFASNGFPRGFSVEYMNLLAQRLGFRVEYITGPKWSEFMEMVKRNELDVMLNIAQSEEREKFLLFSDPYVEFAQVLYTRSETPLISSVGDLYGKKFAVPKGFYFEEVLQKHPKVELVRVKDTTEAILAVASGKADAMIDVMPVVNYIMKDLLITNLKVGGELGMDEGKPISLRIGIRKDWEIFRNILQKGLRAITKNEIHKLRSKWLGFSDKPIITLTSEEEAWLDAHPVTNIAVTTFIPPIDIVDDEGHYSGFNADLIGLLNKRLGTNIVPVFFNKWHDVVESATSGKVDGALSFSRTPERDKHMLFTKPYNYDPIITVIRQEDKRITQKEDIAGKRVSAVKGLAFIELVRSAVGETGEVLEFNNEVDALNALTDGEVDAHISTLIMYGNSQKKEFIPNLRIAVRQNLEGGSQRIAIHKSKPHLFSIIQKGLNSISRTELSELRVRWLSPIPRQKVERRISLTEEERNWMTGHPTIRLGIDLAWPPFEFFGKDGKYSGISSSYIQTISDRLGIKMNPLPDLTWSQAIEKAKVGAVDVLPAIVRDKEREKYLNFTNPYVSFPVVIAAHDDAQYIGNLSDLAGRRVAVVKKYLIEKILTREYPELILVPYTSLSEGLEALDAGEVDAFVDSLGAISYEITRSSFGNIKIAAPTEYNFELAMGVRKDWPELVGILNKTLDDISDKEKAAIRNTWMAHEVKFGLDLKMILIWAVPIGSCIVLIIVFVVIWNQRLSGEVNERKKKEKLIILGAKISQSLTLGDTLKKTLQSITDIFVKELNVVFARIWIVDETENVLKLQASSGLYTHIEGAHESLSIGGDTKISRVVSEKRPHMSNRIEDSPYVKDKDWAREQGLTSFAGIPMVLEGRSVGAMVVFSREAIPEDVIHTIMSVADSIAVAIERNRAEETVRESEERNRLLLESAGEGIFGVDSTGKVVFVNPSAAKMLGYSDEELIDQPMHQLIHHSYPDGSPYPVEKCPLQRACEQGVASQERTEVLWRKDGTSFYVAYMSTPIIKKDDLVGAMVTFMDISEQKRAEDTLQKRLNELTTARLSMLNMMEDLEDTRKESENQNIVLQKEVVERKKMEEELRLNMEDLERFSDMAVGREEKMIQLKEEINELLAQLGKGEKYKIVQ